VRKLLPTLGTGSPALVEVVPFGWKSQFAFLESSGAQTLLRRDPIPLWGDPEMLAAMPFPTMFGVGREHVHLT
jgi:hypothetical protein